MGNLGWHIPSSSSGEKAVSIYFNKNGTLTHYDFILADSYENLIYIHYCTSDALTTLQSLNYKDITEKTTSSVITKCQMSGSENKFRIRLTYGNNTSTPVINISAIGTNAIYNSCTFSTS